MCRRLSCAFARLPLHCQRLVYLLRLCRFKDLHALSLTLCARDAPSAPLHTLRGKPRLLRRGTIVTGAILLLRAPCAGDFARLAPLPHISGLDKTIVMTPACHTSAERPKNSAYAGRTGFQLSSTLFPRRTCNATL